MRSHPAAAASLALFALVLAALLARPGATGAAAPGGPSTVDCCSFERPSPAARASALPAVEPGTTIVVLELTRSGLTLAGSVDKSTPYEEAARLGGDARWCLEDADSGRLLAEGEVALPELCRCGAAGSHLHGCVVIPHEAVIRLKLPRLASRERLVIRRAGRELASLSLEVRS